MKKYRVEGKVFDTLNEALIYAEDWGLSEEDIEVLPMEELSVDDSEEIDMSEVGVKTEKEIEEEILAKEVLESVLEDRQEYSETDIGSIESVALDMTTQNRVGKRPTKKFPEKLTTKNYIEGKYKDLLRKLGDETLKACPLCGESWDSIKLSMRENLDFRDQHKELADKPLILRLHHIKAMHIPIYNLLKSLWEGKLPISEPALTPNPESCSEEDLENLSREELSERIIESPELRAKILRAWKKEKET